MHKSLRGSDTDAALYWFARMIAGGEDPNYIARRLVRFAVEDVGLADPQALVQALAAWQAYERLGSPEGGWRWCNAWFISVARPSRTRPTGRHRPRTPPRARPLADATETYPQRADAAYETWATGGLRVRSRGARRLLRAELLPGRSRAPPALSPSDRGFEREIAARLAEWEKLRARGRTAGDQNRSLTKGRLPPRLPPVAPSRLWSRKKRRACVWIAGSEDAIRVAHGMLEKCCGLAKSASTAAAPGR